MPLTCLHHCCCASSTPHHGHFSCSVIQRWFAHQLSRRDGIAGVQWRVLHPEYGIISVACVMPVLDGRCWGHWARPLRPTVPVGVLACLAAWMEALLAQAPVDGAQRGGD